jgi:hypothetical protein
MATYSVDEENFFSNRDDGQLLRDVSVLYARSLQYTLVSTRGFHCDAWRTSGALYDAGRSRNIDYVVKVSKRPYSLAETRILVRDYRKLRAELDEIVPRASFVVTRVADNLGVAVVAEPCTPWFDLANPGNEAEALPLLRNTSRAQDQLRRFTHAARAWLEQEGRLIDLCGVENLVLDRNQTVRYLDSFNVFLYPDLLDTFAEAGSELAGRIIVAEQRLEYLEGLLDAL